MSTTHRVPRVYPNGEALATAAAEMVAAAIRAGGPPRLVLAGGTTPQMARDRRRERLIRSEADRTKAEMGGR